MSLAELTLIGGPTVVIDLAGLRLLTDPTFDPPGRYAGGAVDLVKTAGPAVDLAALGTIDAVLLSHDQHSDNLDRRGRGMLADAGAVFTTQAGARRLGGRVRGLEPFETATLETPRGTLLVTATPARHGPVGIEPISGDVIGFLLGLDEPGDAIYVTGDTVWYEGTAEVARRYSPRLVLAFAGSAEPRGSFHMTMNANDVIAAAHAFPRARIVAVHNDGWEHFTESAGDLRHAFGALGLSDRLLALEAGAMQRVPLG